MMASFTFGSLFAGIGGFDLGFTRAGMTCKWQVEKDDWCRRVLAKHWPHVKRYGDIKDVRQDTLEPVDLICGGFPCQPYSVAGEQRGTDDDRHLWPEMLRVVSECKPRWVVGENVPGIINIFLDQAIADLESEGYEVWPIVFPACAFDAPHQRLRVFIIGYCQSTDRNNTRMYDDVADPAGDGWSEVEQRNSRGEKGKREACETVQQGNKYFISNSVSKRRSRRSPDSKEQTGQCEIEGVARWPPEPGIRRVADGVPYLVHRIRGLGNAVVPQVSEHIGRLIMETENGK